MPAHALSQLRASAVAVALLLILIVISPVFAASSKIHVAQPTITVMYAPLYFGQQQKVFAAEGIDLEFMTMRTDLAIAALGTGEMDYIVHGGAALRAAAQGFPLKLVFALDQKTPFSLVARPEIKSAAQLRRKKIGVSFPGDTPHIVLKRYLRRQGIDPDRDVSYVAGQFSPTALQGVLAGALDAAVLAPPFNVLAEEKGLSILTFLGDSVPDATTSNGIVTSDKKIKSRPDEVKRMVRASLRSLYAFRQNKSAAVEFLSAHFDIPHNTATRVYADALNILTPQGEISEAKARSILEMAHDTGKTEPLDVQPKSILDFSFVRAAQKELSKKQDR
jgi:ABC-type nitrate/sulfonate/bicarbonate transport system substrate-binding protein